MLLWFLNRLESGASIEDGVVYVVFVGLAALTMPHMGVVAMNFQRMSLIGQKSKVALLLLLLLPLFSFAYLVIWQMHVAYSHPGLSRRLDMKRALRCITGIAGTDPRLSQERAVEDLALTHGFLIHSLDSSEERNPMQSKLPHQSHPRRLFCT